MYGPPVAILLMCVSRNTRRVDFRRLTGSQRTPRVWGVTTYVPEVNYGSNYKVTILHPVQPDVFLPFPLPNVSKMREGVGHEVLWHAELVIPYEGGKEVYHVIFTEVNLFYSVLLLTNALMF